MASTTLATVESVCEGQGHSLSLSLSVISYPQAICAPVCLSLAFSTDHVKIHTGKNKTKKKHHVLKVLPLWSW